MKNSLPIDDPFKMDRRMSLVAMFIFSLPAIIVFNFAFTMSLWLLIPAFCCLGIPLVCFLGYWRHRREQLEFLRDRWNEDDVRKIMAENESKLRHTETYKLLIPQGTATTTLPRSVSLGLRLLYPLLSVAGRRYRLARSIDSQTTHGVYLAIWSVAIPFLGFVTFSTIQSQKGLFDIIVSVFMLSVVCAIWGVYFIQGCRVISLLRHGHVTCGVSRSHYLTGNFFQFNDKNGNMHWKYLPYDTTKKPKKITVLYDPRKPTRCLILDELVHMKQIQITETGGFLIDFQQIQPIFIALGIWIAYGGFFLSFWLQKK